MCESVLKDRLSHLSMTSVDDEGCFKAWWPSTTSLLTYRIKLKIGDGTSNGRILMIKEDLDVAIFCRDEQQMS